MNYIIYLNILLFCDEQTKYSFSLCSKIFNKYNILSLKSQQYFTMNNIIQVLNNHNLNNCLSIYPKCSYIDYILATVKSDNLTVFRLTCFYSYDFLHYSLDSIKIFHYIMNGYLLNKRQRKMLGYC
jgi:hypothetical protein